MICQGASQPFIRRRERIERRRVRLIFMIKRRKKYSKNKEHNDYDYDSKEWNHLIREPV